MYGLDLGPRFVLRIRFIEPPVLSEQASQEEPNFKRRTAAKAIINAIAATLAFYHWADSKNSCQLPRRVIRDGPRRIRRSAIR